MSDRALGFSIPHAVMDGRAGPCPIVIQAGAFDYPLEPEQFQQIVAHEMFHCFQGANLEAQWGPGYKVVKWWVEGTAEYFSNEVYPRADLEQRWLDDFNLSSAYQSILFLNYENFILFQYLGNRLGNEEVLSLIRTMPTTPTASTGDQTRHLAKYPDIHNLFQQFGRDYFDGKIIDSSGVAIPSDALPLHFTSEDVNKGTVIS